MKRILAIDGGGIRGLIPAIILAEIEKRTGKPIASQFDLIAGTSTGGILALGLTVPGTRKKPKYSAGRLIDLYKKEGATIFSRSPWHRMTSGGGLLDQKYPAKGIESVLATYFGNARLKDTITPVLVTGYEIEMRMPWFFKTRYAQNPELKGYDFALTQVARATSAAPTYFEPARVQGAGTKRIWTIVDGGVCVNNPSLCALAEARSMFGANEDIYLLSLGTGELTRRIAYKEAKDWGLAEWARPILDVVFDGVSDATDYQIGQLLPPRNRQRRYHRLQVQLTMGNDEMDDPSERNLFALEALATKLVEKNSTLIDEVCRMCARK
jgi:patatin-like phospholipase/acyl hydrolase